MRDLERNSHGFQGGPGNGFGDCKGKGRSGSNFEDCKGKGGKSKGGKLSKRLLKTSRKCFSDHLTWKVLRRNRVIWENVGR
eukprot:UN15896